MKYRTLLRVMLKAIGVFVVVQSLPSFLITIHLLVRPVAHHASATASSSLMSTETSPLHYTFDLVSRLSSLLAGLYLMFGGKWLVNVLIPRHRAYCRECGNDLSGSHAEHCGDCGAAVPAEALVDKDASPVVPQEFLSDAGEDLDD